MTPDLTPIEGVEGFDSARELAPNTSAATEKERLPPVAEPSATLRRAVSAWARCLCQTGVGPLRGCRCAEISTRLKKRAA